MDLNSVLSSLIEYRYWLIVPLTLVQGPIVMVLGGFLLHLGYFSFLPLYLILMATDLCADIIWYVIGSRWGRPFLRRYGYFFSLNEEIIDKVERLFHKYHGRILFISKITMGLGFAIAVLFTAGVSKVPFRTYLLINIVGGFIWTALLISVGYFLGNIYEYVDQGLKLMTLIAFAIIVIAAGFGFSKYIRNRILAGKI